MSEQSYFEQFGGEDLEHPFETDKQYIRVLAVLKNGTANYITCEIDKDGYTIIPDYVDHLVSSAV